MTTRRLPPGPPRAIRKGDVVAAYCDELGEWSAAQVIALESREQAANVLDLDWAGPEPERLEDLGELKPLRDPEIPGWAQYSRDWGLPRSHKILGNAPRLRTQRSGGYRSGGWRTGYELYRRRLRRVDPVDPRDPLRDQIGETGLHRMLSDPAFRNPHLLDLTITSGPVTGPDVACDRLVEAFPNLTRLTIWGVMGRLGNAAALHNLTSLRTVELEEVFGMGAADCLDPAVMTSLEHIELRTVPADYATAMRRAWKPEVPKGVFLSITGARKPEWVAQNMNNPIRGWDGREGITAPAYAKARAAWNQTTAPILAVLVEDLPHAQRLERLHALGVAFAQAFDEANFRRGFIETQERDELLDGLANLVGAAPIGPEVNRNVAADMVLHAVNDARTW